MPAARARSTSAGGTGPPPPARRGALRARGRRREHSSRVRATKAPVGDSVLGHGAHHRPGVEARFSTAPRRRARSGPPCRARPRETAGGCTATGRRAADRGSPPRRGRAHQGRHRSCAALGFPVVPEVMTERPVAPQGRWRLRPRARRRSGSSPRGAGAGKNVHPCRVGEHEPRADQVGLGPQLGGSERTMSGNQPAKPTEGKRSTTVAGWFAARTATRSPGLTPAARRAPAVAATSA